MPPMMALFCRDSEVKHLRREGHGTLACHSGVGRLETWSYICVNKWGQIVKGRGEVV